MTTSSSILLWFDAEFTDLAVDRAALLQVACIATDMSGRRISTAEKDVNCILKLSPETVVSAWVSEHLTDLLEVCRSDRAMSLEEAEQRLVNYAADLTGGTPEAIGDRPVLAGNSIHMDHWAVRVHLPTFHHCLHYRLFDVSTLKQIAAHQGVGDDVDKEDEGFIREYGLGEPLDGQPHDAYYDIHASIAEYRFYREKLIRGGC